MIPPSTYDFISIDLPAMLTATFAAISCGLLGNFLVLRRLSLMGDAISHAVLPGIVIAFLVTSSRASLPVFIGATIAGVVTAVLVELVRKLGRVESGAAMGVVFSILFALGVLLIEQAAARSIDLDADCLLHGQLERIFWFPPQQWPDVFSLATLSQLPQELFASAGVLLITVLFLVVFYKELKLSSFDPLLASQIGFSSTFMHYLLMVVVAAAVVASFEAVGSILVIAMIICPAATARLLTDRLAVQIWLSALIATATGILGYLFGAFGPQWVGFEHSVNAAGMMTVVAGIFLAATVVFAPHYGVLARQFRRLRFALNVAREDILGLLFRIEEIGETRVLSEAQVCSAIGDGLLSKLALQRAVQHAQVQRTNNGIELTDAGRHDARSLVRTHRLWESFLVRELGLRPDHVHPTAMDLEHFTSPEMADELAAAQPGETRDPHDKPIPDLD